MIKFIFTFIASLVHHPYKYFCFIQSYHSVVITYWVLKNIIATICKVIKSNFTFFTIKRDNNTLIRWLVVEIGDTL